MNTSGLDLGLETSWRTGRAGSRSQNELEDGLDLDLETSWGMGSISISKRAGGWARSRSRNELEDGLDLGLSLCKKIFKKN